MLRVRCRAQVKSSEFGAEPLPWNDSYHTNLNEGSFRNSVYQQAARELKWITLRYNVIDISGGEYNVPYTQRWLLLKPGDAHPCEVFCCSLPEEFPNIFGGSGSFGLPASTSSFFLSQEDINPRFDWMSDLHHV